MYLRIITSITFSGPTYPAGGVFGKTCACLTSGRVKKPKAVFTSHDLAVLSGPVNVLVTRPSGQIPLGVHSSKTQTMSFTSNLASGFNHFFLVFRVGMYTFRILFQIASSRCRTWVHVFVWIVGVSLKTHAGTLGIALPIKKWLGVNGSSSSMSLLTCVKGLALTRLSVSITMVEKTSHVNFADSREELVLQFERASPPPRSAK